MSTHSSADKLRDLHAESLRYNIPCCTAALALPEIAAVIEAAEQLREHHNSYREWVDSGKTNWVGVSWDLGKAVDRALAALSARLGDVTSQKDGAS